MQLFLDLDGVLADFDEAAYKILNMNPRRFEKQMGSAAFWSRLEYSNDNERTYFFENLNIMHDALDLYFAVKHCNPIILTGIPKQYKNADEEKNKWIDKHFGSDMPRIICYSKDKRNYMEPGDVIVDDWPQHRHLWEEAGGIWVDHKSAEFTIKALQKLSVI